MRVAELLISGGVPVLMKLLGHKSPNMTMRYGEVSLLDVEHEFQLARLQPRHLVPTPRTPRRGNASARTLAFRQQST